MTQLNPVAELSVDEMAIGRGECVTDEVEMIEMTDVRSEGLKSLIQIEIGRRGKVSCESGGKST